MLSLRTFQLMFRGKLIHSFESLPARKSQIKLFQSSSHRPLPLPMALVSLASCKDSAKFALPHLQPQRISYKCQNMQIKSLSSQDAPKAKQQEGLLTVYFVSKDGTKMPAKGKVGDNLLDIVLENNVDIDGFGACEGTLACSTCHLILKKKDYDALPEEPSDEELDMLDLAFELSDTSRLGCQIYLTKEMDGLEVAVPAGVSDARE